MRDFAVSGGNLYANMDGKYFPVRVEAGFTEKRMGRTVRRVRSYTFAATGAAESIKPELTLTLEEAGAKYAVPPEPVETNPEPVAPAKKK
jgi:hypothetical protein